MQKYRYFLELSRTSTDVHGGSENYFSFVVQNMDNLFLCSRANVKAKA